ncbi:MAG: transposase zinc-binding domain-containing protein [Pseudomonadota bacterium]
MFLPAAVYRPRNPQSSDYYRCVEDYFEIFVGIYDEHFSRQYGFWRPYVEQVIHRYLHCGNLHNGFARVKYKNCDHEYLLAFSCKHRCFQLAIRTSIPNRKQLTCRYRSCQAKAGL